MLKGICVVDIGCFPQFDINKFMSEEQNNGKSQTQILDEVPKRRRIPSQYAHQIADFKNNFSTVCKKTKNGKAPEPGETYELQTTLPQGKPLACLLPSGKKLSLRIVVGECRSTKIDKVDKKKSKPPVLNSSPPPKAREQKGKEVTVSFFDKFLSVVEELQKKQEPEERELNQASKQNGESRRRDQKFRRERQQKWTKAAERYRTLTERFDILAQNFTFLK